ncbi:regulatory protein, Fis family [Salegentibacter holothuriorum]|uniref:Regulatory protein, Fis family n=2 Tax=Salegentibacter holothuriorum TaxID=241145 RepID=A0A1T5BEP5_9FLAO|nr:regulatory protein, Fis family [Salegentibacter holothuriorum]
MGVGGLLIPPLGARGPMESIQAVKQRFGIIGDDQRLNRAIEKAIQVAPTDISVLVTGESGVGKESIPKIIHSLSHRKHGKYIAVNCGAIPEGTIDSELFGHEKGAFTGATQTRSGYFEVADGGTIFLDEVGELPLPTQVRLLRVLENGEFIKVGSSKVQKSDVRIIAATNINMQESIKKERFREDLYYRLSTVEINLPPLRDRKEDIHLLFRKFASDFALKYKMPTIKLQDDAVSLLQKYRWGGNIRQLRNIAEQISVLEQERIIGPERLKEYLPNIGSNLPAVISDKKKESDFSNEREILYKVLFDMKSDLTDLKKLTLKLMESGNTKKVQDENESLIQKIYGDNEEGEDIDAEELDALSNENLEVLQIPQNSPKSELNREKDKYYFAEEIEEEETLSLQDKELELIKKSLERHSGKRKAAAEELGISERTLYRKIKQYNL